MSVFWFRLLFAAGWVGLLFLVVSAALGPTRGLLAAAFGLAAYLGYQLWQLGRLHAWLSQPNRPAPAGAGAWGDVLHLLDKQLRLRQDSQLRAVADMEQMREATRSLPDGVVILDLEDRIVWLNEAAGRQLGLSQSRDIGQFIYYLLRQTRFTEWLALEDFSQPLQIRSPSVPECTLSLQMVPMPRRQRMLLAHDITELARVDAMRRDFVANVSHELRTPITVISGFLEAFDEMERPDPKEFARHVHLMREQSDRIRQLLDDLLTLARLESDLDMKNETVDVPALLAQLLAEARSLSQDRHDIRLLLDSRAKVIGRAGELHSAFGNLVSNAVRYTPDGGRITLRWVQPESGGAEFSVTDTGEGIEAQHIPRLTERFYRVDRGRSRASGGTGLGLAIVKHVLQRHQGRLRVESTVGKGSTFTAVLPADRIIPESAPADAPAPEPSAA
jgi:two-component system phosphate regulon sensor histidine kinase PhoR